MPLLRAVADAENMDIQRLNALTCQLEELTNKIYGSNAPVSHNAMSAGAPASSPPAVSMQDEFEALRMRNQDVLNRLELATNRLLNLV